MDDRNILRLSPRDMEYFNQAIRSIENSDLSNLQNAISKDSQVIRKKNTSGLFAEFSLSNSLLKVVLYRQKEVLRISLYR